MLFYTWPFLFFMLIVGPVFFMLRETRFWLLWLIAASCFFYAWWNPYYLVLIAYIAIVVFLLLALMERCPVESQKVDLRVRLLRLRFDDKLAKIVFIFSILVCLVFGSIALAGPKTLRPFTAGLGLIMLFMALGALYSSRGIWLVFGIFITITPLLFFKYAQFIVDNLNAILAWLHVAARLPDASTLMPFGLDYLLPIGISFFTFQSLGYLIDFYLGKAKREGNFLRLANFVCFFPLLMAGPIERAEHLLPQFRQFPAIRLQNFSDALSLFVIGLFKKVTLAGYLSLYVDRVYEVPQFSGASALILASVAYAWQIFFDFGGYTDMARGVAKLMGFNLVLNFNHPYLATGIGDFWRRWHISFSRWILDYIFMPLQLRWREWRSAGTALALVVTFLVSGIWHGAAWPFVIWGALHGLGLASTYGLERSAFYRKRVPKILKQVLVFAFVTFAWIFFRANSLPDALLIVRRIFTAVWQDPKIPMLMLALVALVWLYEFLCESRLRNMLQTGFVRVSIAVLMVLSLFFSSSGGGSFIYFQF